MQFIIKYRYTDAKHLEELSRLLYIRVENTNPLPQPPNTSYIVQNREGKIKKVDYMKPSLSSFLTTRYNRNFFFNYTHLEAITCSLTREQCPKHRKTPKHLYLNFPVLSVDKRAALQKGIWRFWLMAS